CDLCPQQGKRLLFISPRSLHHHQLHLVLSTKGGQFGDPCDIVREATGRSFTPDPGLQRTRSNIHSTNDLGHGNLPCTCDWKSGDCSVVRASDGGPKAHTRFSKPEGSRAPSAARGVRSLRPPHSDIPPQSVALLQIQGIGSAWPMDHPITRARHFEFEISNFKISILPGIRLLPRHRTIILT